MGCELNYKNSFNAIEDEHLIFKDFSTKLCKDKKNIEQNTIIINKKIIIKKKKKKINK